MMKNRKALIGLFLFMVIISCNKEQNECDYCVNKIINSPNTSILSEAELKTIKSLFDFNHLSYSNLQFFRLQTDELGYHHVRCYQYINNLILYSNDLIFHFNQNNVYYFLSGDLFNKIDLDNKTTMNQNDVIEIFFKEVEKDFYSIDEINCVDLEFGYCDLDTDTGGDHPFAKAWRVKPKGKDYPVAYIDDTKHELIGYSNGIINM